MPADVVTAKVALDRELVDHFVVELDGIASLECIRNGRNETVISEHLFRVVGEIEETLGDLAVEEREDLYRRGSARGEELAEELFGGGESDG